MSLPGGIMQGGVPELVLWGQWCGVIIETECIIHVSSNTSLMLDL